MKKKLISFLLIIVLVAALVPVSAFAEPAVAIYTLTGTTSIVDLCAAHGVDYNTYKVLIMALNSVSNENAFAQMGAGSRVVVPINANAAATLAGISGAGIISGTAPGTTAASGSASAAGAAPGTPRSYRRSAVPWSRYRSSTPPYSPHPGAWHGPEPPD